MEVLAFQQVFHWDYCDSDIEQVAGPAVAGSASSFFKTLNFISKYDGLQKTNKTPNKKSLSLFRECQLRAKITCVHVSGPIIIKLLYVKWNSIQNRTMLIK